jgi:hypothetical protein
VPALGREVWSACERWCNRNRAVARVLLTGGLNLGSCSPSLAGLILRRISRFHFQ